jgi:D-serine deaminase-like pyridoxal phosphate-dependent protein
MSSEDIQGDEWGAYVTLCMLVLVQDTAEAVVSANAEAGAPVQLCQRVGQGAKRCGLGEPPVGRCTL